MSAPVASGVGRPPINGRYRIPFSVWSIVFRFAAGTSYFVPLDRSPLCPVKYDEAGQVVGYDREVRAAYEEHKATLQALLGVCREWREVLRHFRLEWTIITSRNILTDFLRHPTEPGFVPIRRLDLRLRLLTGSRNPRSLARDLATLLTYCERIEVLTIISSDYDAPDAAHGSDVYIETIAPVLSTRPSLRKFASNLPIRDITPVLSFLTNSASIGTIDVCPASAPTPATEFIPSSSNSIRSARISFDEVAPRILHTLSTWSLPNLDYLWFADYVDPAEEPAHPALTAAFHAFIDAHGDHLRSLVLVTNAYSLSMDMWAGILGACPGLVELSCTLPLAQGFTFTRPRRGLPHAALRTIIFNGFSTLSESGPTALRTEVARFLASLPTSDFLVLQTIRLDISLRSQTSREPNEGARGMLRHVLEACAPRQVHVQDREGGLLSPTSLALR